MSNDARLAWYRLRTTFGRRWGGYLGVALLIGLVGGVAMGAVAGARRTDSSFHTFLASTNPSTVMVLSGLDDPDLGQSTGYNPKMTRAVAHSCRSSSTSTHRSASTATSTSAR